MKAPILASLVIGSVIVLGCRDDASKNEPTAPGISASSVQASSGNLVAGSAQITIGGERRQISLSAVRRQDGTVSGEYELDGAGTRLHAQITCFQVGVQTVVPHFDGVTAVGGVVTQSTDPAAVGEDLSFIIKGTADQLSPPHIFFGVGNGPFVTAGQTYPNIAAAFCTSPGIVTDAGDSPLYPIQAGHLEIR